MRVSLMRKLWKQKVEVPVLEKEIDKILKAISVKLKKGVKYVREDKERS
jgi:hypothetical protein